MKYIALAAVDNNVLIRGDECIINLEELYRALSDPECTEIVINKEFYDKYFTFPALCDFVENCGTVAPNVTVTVPDTVYTDMNSAVREIARYKTAEEISYAMVANPTKFIATLQSLCSYYFAARDEASIANNRASELMLLIDELQQDKSKMKSEMDKITEHANESVASLQALVNRVNFRYEKTVNPDEMFVLHENQYKHILYIKEITRVRFVDTMLYYLQEIMKTLYSAPIRTVVIEPFYAYSRAELYPQYKPHWNLSYRDVYKGNIFMAGIQPKVMKDVLQNSSHLHYLVILDRGGYMVPHVSGGNVSTIYTAATIEDAPSDAKDIISYQEDTLNIPYIEDFDELSPEERIQKYSSMNIMQTLVNKLEEEL